MTNRAMRKMRGHEDEELVQCQWCKSERIDDTDGLWLRDQVADYYEVEENFTPDGFLVDNPICPIHHEEMDDVVFFEEGW